MKAVAIIANLSKPNVHEIARDITAWLEARRVKVYSQQELGCGQGFSLGEPLPPADLIMVLGGDGTFLAVAGMYGPSGIPLLGVNLGHLGFLTEVEVGDLEQDLDKLVQGDYCVERRGMLDARVFRQGKLVSQALALNDVVVAKGPLARILHLEVAVEGVRIGNYRGDGVIVATPTGSTGYSLSAGGPIVPPNVDIILVTPICPHTLNARPIVVDKGAVITVRTMNSQSETFITLDGQQGMELDCDAVLEITSSKHETSLVRLKGKNFFDILAKKIVDQDH
ncbi:MAG: NAD(+)/NADH kinase [Firmicutes bacterium]|nr:NAD(+)/NADH kinase [Bacillota bacterium]